jgi:hypothetical protein
MSRYYANYPQYLGAMKCCDLRGQGPIGPIGPTGPSAIGPIGPPGPGIPFGGASGDASTTNGVWYDSSSNQFYYASAKSFIIDHPIEQHKYLVHACLEGPEAGVYYRGTGEILDNISTIIELPNYVTALATDFTVQITPIYNGKINVVNTSELVNNKFTVYGENCKFYWQVTGKRSDVMTEPFKTDVEVKGQGPYLYI